MVVLDTKSVLNICQKVTENLKELLGERLVGVALFGSYAREDAHERSDIDLFVIAEGLPEHPMERYPMLSSSRTGIGASSPAVKFIAYTPEEFLTSFPSLFLDIGLDAKVIYDPTGFLEEHLKRIREIIEEAGLYRVQLEKGFLWRWKKPPKPRWIVDWEGFREF